MAVAPIDCYKRMRQAQKESVSAYPEMRFEIILIIYLMLLAILGTALLADFIE